MLTPNYSNDKVNHFVSYLYCHPPKELYASLVVVLCPKIYPGLEGRPPWGIYHLPFVTEWISVANTQRGDP
jgi:hypothetical protein